MMLHTPSQCVGLINKINWSAIGVHEARWIFKIKQRISEEERTEGLNPMGLLYSPYSTP